MSTLTDDVSLVYPSELSTHFKSSTLWSKFTVIKRCYVLTTMIHIMIISNTKRCLQAKNVIFSTDETTKFAMKIPG